MKLMLVMFGSGKYAIRKGSFFFKYLDLEKLVWVEHECMFLYAGEVDAVLAAYQRYKRKRTKVKKDYGTIMEIL